MEKNMKNVFSMSIHIDIIQLLEKHLDKEYQEHLDYAKDRNWQDAGFESVEDYIEDVECFSDDEHTLWERGYRYGVQDAIDIIKNLLKE